MRFDVQRSLVSCVIGMLLAASATAASSANRPAAGSPGTAPADDRTFTEQSIYIPYEKLRDVFERQGRGVFLPYEEFEKLWRAAREKTTPPVEPGPPVDALITEASHEAVVARDVVQVAANLKVELLRKGWKEIPLRLNTSAITAATIADQPARIIFDPKTGYNVLLEKKADGSEVVDLKIEYAQAYSKTPGQNSVTFQPPQAPVSRWTIRIAEPGVKVNIQPLIAATEVPADGGATTRPGQTVVLAFVGAAPTVRLDWTPKAEGATGLEALVSVQAEQQVTVDEGVTRTRTELRYEISRAEMTRLVVAVPSDQKIVNVLDANVRQWSVQEANGRQEVTVQLFEPARAAQRVTVELEHFRKEADLQEVVVPVVEAVGVGRHQGSLVVQVASGLRAEATRHAGLLQIDAGELPASLAKTRWTFAYRFNAVPFDLRIQIEKIQPRILADSLIEAHLEPEQITIEMLNLYTIEQAGVFQLELEVPAEYEIRQVRGREASGAQPVQVDTHDRRVDDKSKLVVNLSRKATGRVALAVRLYKRLSEPDLLAPTGHAASISLPLPRVVGTAIERATGRLILHAPESLRVDTGKIEGLRPISFAEAVQNMDSPADRRFTGARPVVAFAFGEEAVKVALSVERRKPQVTVRQLMAVSIDSGAVKYDVTFFYEILYSGVKSLRIDIPADLAPDVRNTTQGVRDRVIDPAPKDLREGYVAWGFTGETEFAGTATIHLSWERKLDKLEVGKSVELAIPHLRPEQVDRAWGQIVLTKAEAMDVQEAGEPTGIRPIDPQYDLMPGTAVPNAARAFEFHSDWQLRVKVTRYKLEEVKRTSIERAVIQMVVTRGGQTSVQALYRIRSAHQRLAVKLPKGIEFDSEPLRLNGRRVPLERGEKDEFFVPLVGMNPDQEFLLELRYTLKEGGLCLDPPAFPAEPAIQKVYLCAFLPAEYTFLGAMGPWTDELEWVWSAGLTRRPVATYTAIDRVAWVSEGIQTSGGPADTFQSDGRMYLFSALRPAAPPEGSLRLVAMDEHWLGALVLVLILVPGVALIRARAPVRWLAAGLLVVLLIAIGIFFPTLSRQIVDGRLLAAVAVVLVIWLLHYVVWVRPHDPAVIARQQAIAEARLARARAKAQAAESGTGPPPSQPGASPGAGAEGTPERGGSHA